MRILSRSAEKLREDGAVDFLGTAFKYAGQKLERTTSHQRKQKIIESYSDEQKYLNIGGGTFLKDHWRVLDYYSDWYDYDSDFIDFNVDLEERRQWPIDSNDYQIVYSSHTLEHLTDKTVKHTLSESYRILEPGGIIRINVPDVDLAINKYEKRDLEWFENVWLENYSNSIYYVDEKSPEFELEFYLLSFFATYLSRIRHQETDFQQVRDDWRSKSKKEFLQKYSGKIRDDWQSQYPGWHRNWFTGDRVESLLQEAGFEEIQESGCRQSVANELCTSHFDKRPHISLFIEAQKPYSSDEQ